ncbi:MAG: CinA family protein [Candidatus Binataceae bacterium]
MQELLPIADELAALLKARRETIAITESSTGGLISAALLSVAGASAFFIGGGVLYTIKARRTVLDLPDAAFAEMRPSTEPYAMTMARRAQQRFATTWTVAETGATGPTGNRYGDAAGHTCIAIAGPIERTLTLETGSDNRVRNMYAFAAAALNLLKECIAASPKEC